jgi:MSHA biogenesis protein MshJ
LIKNLQQWKERFDALTLRERALVLLGALGVLYMAWDNVLMERVRGQQKQTLTQMQKLSGQIRDIDARIQSVSAALNPAGQTSAQRRLENLKSELARMNQRQEAIAVSFIRPQEMVGVLKGLLAQERGLKLTRVQSRAAQPFVIPQPASALTQNTANAKPKQQDSQNGVQSAAPKPTVYKHGLEIQFQGSYASTLSYLQKIETLPWRFYWDEVGYEVLDYPKAQITVKIHTLSLEREWISV